MHPSHHITPELGCLRCAAVWNANKDNLKLRLRAVASDARLSRYTALYLKPVQARIVAIGLYHAAALTRVFFSNLRHVGVISVERVELIDTDITVRKASNDIECAAHGFDVAAERADIEVGPAFDLGDFRLGRVERHRKLFLCEMPGTSDLLQWHLLQHLLGELRRAGTR